MILLPLLVWYWSALHADSSEWCRPRLGESVPLLCDSRVYLSPPLEVSPLLGPSEPLVRASEAQVARERARLDALLRDW